MDEIKHGYKKTDIGVIPEEWNLSLVRNLGVFSKGSGISRAESNTGKLPSIRYGEIYTVHNDYIKKFSSFISTEVAKKAKRLKCGDILFTASGETKEDIGKCVAFIHDIEAYAGGDIIILSPRNANSLFLGFLFNAPYVVKQKANKGQGDAIVHITKASVGDITVALPESVNEQTAIATALSDTDALIAAMDKKIAKKQQIKQGTMQRIMKPKENWKTSKLGDLTKLFTKQTGFDYSAFIKPSLIQSKAKDTIPFIQNKDFKNKWINFNTDYFIPLSIAKQFPKILLDEKSLLISISGSVGNVGLYDSKELAFIGGAIAILKFKNQDIIDWVMFYLNSEEGQRKLFDNVKAGSHQNLILDDIRKIEILLPPLNEQITIAKILTDMDQEIAQLEKERDKYVQLKSGMMQVLLTGRVRLINPEN